MYRIKSVYSKLLSKVWKVVKLLTDQKDPAIAAEIQIKIHYSVTRVPRK